MTRVLFWDAKEAGAAIAGYRIVKPGSADGKVVQSAAAGNSHIGVSYRKGAKANETVEIARVGVAEVEYGDTITRGALLTSDADGKAVAAGAGNRVIGTAEISGVDGDIGQVLLAPGLH